MPVDHHIHSFYCWMTRLPCEYVCLPAFVVICPGLINWRHPRLNSAKHTHQFHFTFRIFCFVILLIFWSSSIFWGGSWSGYFFVKFWVCTHTKKIWRQVWRIVFLWVNWNKCSSLAVLLVLPNIKYTIIKSTKQTRYNFKLQLLLLLLLLCVWMCG